MTAKRFTLTATDYIYDNQDKAICPTLESIVTLLNELHEENIMLKGELAHYKLILMSLEKEAKRLSQIR